MGTRTTRATRAQRPPVNKNFTTPQKPNSQVVNKAGQTPENPINLTGNTLSPSSVKRKAHEITSEDVSYQMEKEDKVKGKGKSKKQKTGKEEKRLRRFRPKPPQSFHEIYDRALSQRFYVLNRVRGGTKDCPNEDIEMTGSTGNIYTVHIGKQPRCTCPHNQNGHQCKHILYVMKQVLHAPFELVYQLALLSTELQTIFTSAPPISAPGHEHGGESDKRKPIEGDCPICYCELDEKNPESIVWCAAACGQNIHEECFKMWAQTKRGGGNVTCPMCRSVWKGDENLVARVRKDQGDVDEEGYVNVADQLGISRQRDESSYSRWYGYHQRRRNENWGGYTRYRRW
ncbi:E3 ubiquitin-protein ligase Zswim2 [Fusarium austroafricanum]|uniref:E3 ubiquitin-protein ligase Zswim2 n=1 Tax=Fusarium austroafricanum TaxID=2364996 RepID=A0A8H4NX28_9HYPO|nr:E3 ubiquitin-protein ligase Zswim2 [Fusarium austroafricanum]